MHRLALVGALLSIASPAYAGWPDIWLSGLAQPQVKWEQDDPTVMETNPRNSGFALHRARIQAGANLQGKRVLWEAKIEADMVPGFQLLDAYLAGTAELPRNGFLRVVAGQQFAPFSRQTILPAHTLQMVDYAQLTTLTPGRQLGLSATLAIPAAPWLQVSAGWFNGKGVNVVENIDTNFMYVGRVAFRPIGERAPLVESALGPDAIWIAGDISYNEQKLGDFTQKQLLLGADAFWSYRGFSAYVEYLWGDTTYTAGAPKQNYHEQGFNGQAGYLLPIPGWMYRRFEVTARFEAVAPNQTVPITGPGDPTQARAAYIAGMSYYHREHKLKLQANYIHNQQLDSVDAAGKPATYNNDSFIVQLTYKLE
jgi:hypothetical protein